MILGNRTETPRAVYIGKRYVDIPPMGTVTVDKIHESAIKAAIKPLLDAGILVVNTQINPNERPVEVPDPVPPVELAREPENPRVTAKKIRKTSETMKV